MTSDSKTLLRPLLVSGLSIAIALGLVWFMWPTIQATGWLTSVGVGAPPIIHAQASNLPPVPSVVPVTINPPQPALISLAEAQGRVSFTIRVPGTLPDGYRLLGVVPTPTIPTGGPDLPANAPAQPVSPPELVVLVFGNDAGDRLHLSELQTSVSAPQNAPPPPAHNGSVEQVTVNGQPAYYVEDQMRVEGAPQHVNHRLSWQDGEGVMYNLNSQVLGRDALLAVANSVR